MKELVRVPITLTVMLLAGCSYGPDGGRVGETGQVQVLANTALPEPRSADLIRTTRPYLVGPQDVLIVDVFGIDTLVDREITVDGAGRISLPIAGAIEAAGKSPEEVAALITERLRANYVRNPQVSVNVKEALGQLVTVDGEVTQPGLYPVMGDMTLTRAIASARGLSEFAKQDDVVILRTVEGKRYAGVYNLAAIRRGNYADPTVYANDVVIVGDSAARRRMRDLLGILPAITSPLIYLLDNN